MVEDCGGGVGIVRHIAAAAAAVGREGEVVVGIHRSREPALLKTTWLRRNRNEWACELVVRGMGLLL